jgi:hypothetical protein
MSRRTIFWVVALLFSTLILGCSGGDNPVTPAENPGVGLDLAAQTDQAVQSQAQLWGYFDLYFNVESKTIEAVPNRSAEFAANVVKFLNNDPLGLQVHFNGTYPGTGCIYIDMDVTIKHPLTDHAYDGYDVRGIFMGNGSAQLEYNSDLVYPVQGTDQVIPNPDGYTRWFNPTEFPVPKIFGYVPGNLASKNYTPTATLNPYRYFGEGLGAADYFMNYLVSGGPEVGYFLAGTSLKRNYVIQFPLPLPGVKYAYAVVANWAGVAPQFHPSHAPEAVGVEIHDTSNLYYVDETTKGGSIRLDISVFDWDAELTAGVMEDYQIVLESAVLSAAYLFDTGDMTPTASGDHWFAYHIDIPADNLTGNGIDDVWVIVEDSTADYTNPLGVPNSADGDKIAACFRKELIVSDVEPNGIQVTAPNGGEQWKAGGSSDITWTSTGDIQNVIILLSLDSGGDYTHIISNSTPNDGSFTWDPIPLEVLGDHNRIEIANLDDQSVFDDSDADFSVVLPDIQLITPNGGEAWGTGSTQEISWTFNPAIENVNIFLSLNSGGNYSYVLAGPITNTGSWQWDSILPEHVSANCRIKVASAEIPGIYDESDADFEIYESWINLTSPNGGEWLSAGSTFEITWETSVPGGTVDIAFTTDDWNSEIYEIDANAPNTGSYMWTVPFTLSDTAIVGITIWDPFIQDASDGYFHIIEGGWARTGDSGGAAFGVVADDGGYIYTAGVSLTRILWKYDPAGSMLWEKTWGEPGTVEGGAIAIDDNGDLYVVGRFSGTGVDFDPGPGTDLHTAEGQDSAFLCKYDASGTYLWGRNWGRAYGLAVEVAGTEIYVAGAFWGEDVDFDPSSGIDLKTSGGASDAYIASYNASGNYLWSRTWGDNGGDGATGVAVTTYVYVVGSFFNTVDFDPGVGVWEETSAGSADAFVSCFETDGDWAGVYRWGGTEQDGATGIAEDPFGSFSVVGYFAGSDVDFDPTSGDTWLLSSAGENDAYISFFDSSGVYKYTYRWGGIEGDGASSVEADGDGDFLVGGWFSNASVDFDPGPDDDYHSSNGGPDAYWTLFDSAGDFVMARTWGGTESDGTHGVCFSGTSGQYRIFCAGEFAGLDVEFAPTALPCDDTSDLHGTPNEEEYFLVKYMPDGCW